MIKFLYKMLPYKEIYFPGSSVSVICKDISMFDDEKVIESELEIYFPEKFNEFSLEEKRNIINENITIPLNNLYNSHECKKDEDYILIEFKIFIENDEIPFYIYKSNIEDLSQIGFNIYNVKTQTLYNELVSVNN